MSNTQEESQGDGGKETAEKTTGARRYLTREEILAQPDRDSDGATDDEQSSAVVQASIKAIERTWAPLLRYAEIIDAISKPQMALQRWADFWEMRIQAMEQAEEQVSKMGPITAAAMYRALQARFPPTPQKRGRRRRADYDCAEGLMREGLSFDETWVWFAATCLTEQDLSEANLLEDARSALRSAMHRRGVLGQGHT